MSGFSLCPIEASKEEGNLFYDKWTGKHDPDRFFFLQLHKCEPVTASGRHRMLPEHIICTEHCKHENSLTEKEQKAWETFKDSRKGNEMKLKGKERVKEGEGLGEAGKFGRNEERGWKKGKQKAKETQKLNLRDTPRRERAESCAHFLD